MLAICVELSSKLSTPLALAVPMMSLPKTQSSIADQRIAAKLRI
jgi:hypothetical protein